MSRRRKKCRCCKRWFSPCSQTYRQQITCNEKECRKWRRRQSQARWRWKNPLYEESRRPKLQRWRAEKGAAYMRAYRAKNPGYTGRNRRLQRRRDRRRKNLVKQDEWKSICIEKAARIRRLRYLVKQNEWAGVLWRGIDDLWRKMAGFGNLVKQNDMAPTDEMVHDGVWRGMCREVNHDVERDG